MTLDSNRFKASIPSLQRIYELNKHKDVPTLVSELSIATHIPVLAVCLWIQKLYGTSEALETQIKSLIHFYRYEIIIPIED